MWHWVACGAWQFSCGAAWMVQQREAMGRPFNATYGGRTVSVTSALTTLLWSESVCPDGETDVPADHYTPRPR